MIGASLAPRDRRALLLGGTIAIVSLSWMLGVRPLLARADALHDALARERALLARERGAVAAVDRYTAAFHTGAPRLLDAAPRLFGGADGMAGAELARYIEEAAESAHVFVKRLDPADPTEAGDGLRAIGVTVSGASDLQGLLTFLYTLESGGKLVRVDGLSVRGLGPGEHPSPAAPEALDFELSATGFVLLPWAGQGEVAR